jgi:P4 family phage/plasmid primase-like protien
MTNDNEEKQQIPEDAIWFYYDTCNFSIIPLGVNNADEPEKKPSLTTWDKYKTERPTREEIQQWINDGLFKNIGVICGHVSGDLVIVDIDDETIPEICKINWESILKSGAWPGKTGKGYQIWCRHHGNPGGIKKLLKYHIEYRANNGYCVAPPSIHPNGNIYSFIGIKNYSELPILIKKDVQQIFNEMKKKIGETWNIKDKPTFTGSQKTDAISEYSKCVEIALNSITSKGLRYYTIYGIASAFYFKKIPLDMALQRIKQFNMEKCVPPHSNEIVEQAVKGAYQKDAHRYGCEFWMDDAELCPYENIMECPHGKKKAKQELAKKYNIFTYKEKENDKKEKYYVKDGVICPRLADLIQNEYDFHFSTTIDNKEIFYYNDGVYHNNGETTISMIAEDYMEDLSTVHRKNEVISHIQDANYVSREVFNTDIELLNLENGVYNIKTKELQPHSPERFFINKLNVKYNKDATCPKIQKFLSEVIYKEDIPVIQEFFGYCLHRRYDIHKACMFLGGGKNGKSTVIRLLVKMLKDDNVSNKALQDLMYNRFAINSLYGKLLNAAADISDQALDNTGLFKQLTGEDRVDAEKKFKDSYGFTNYAKFLFSANTLPKTKDESYAFYRRWILISFPNTFEGKKCNKNLIDEITTEDELSGLLNWSLQGLERLMENGDFIYSKSVDDVMEQYKTMSDPIYAYCKKFLQCDEKEHVLKDELWKHYSKWCEENKLPKIPKNILTRELSKNLSEMRIGRTGGKGHQKHAFMGIKWQKQDNPTTKTTGEKPLW